MRWDARYLPVFCSYGIETILAYARKSSLRFLLNRLGWAFFWRVSVAAVAPFGTAAIAACASSVFPPSFISGGKARMGTGDGFSRSVLPELGGRASQDPIMQGAAGPYRDCCLARPPSVYTTLRLAYTRIPRLRISEGWIQQPRGKIAPCPKAERGCRALYIGSSGEGAASARSVVAVLPTAGGGGAHPCVAALFTGCSQARPHRLPIEGALSPTKAFPVCFVFVLSRGGEPSHAILARLSKCDDRASTRLPSPSERGA